MPVSESEEGLDTTLLIKQRSPREARKKRWKSVLAQLCSTEDTNEAGRAANMN